MKVLNSEEEDEYALLMDKIATVVFVESVKHVQELNESKVDPLKSVEEISMAVGQVVLDKIIDVTKDMSREKILRIFSEVAITYSINVMQKHPEYKMRIAFLNGLG